MKTLAQIFDYLAQHDKLPESTEVDKQTKVTGLTLDSRQVKVGFAFIALQGAQYHGLDFLQTAVSKGAALVVADRPLSVSEQEMVKHSGVKLLAIEKMSMQALGEFAHWFYDSPTSKLKVIGVTGTNGKTSTAFYCAQLLASHQLDKQPVQEQGQKQKVAVIGTLGNGALDDLQATANTTPDSVTLAKLFADFVEQGFTYVVMEVSSHAIALDRIAGVNFYITALTQIGSDHLDFHGSQSNYAATKLSFLSDYAARYRVVNLDDDSFREGYFASEMVASKNPRKSDGEQPISPAWLGYSQTPGIAEEFFNHVQQVQTWQGCLLATNQVLDSAGVQFQLNASTVIRKGSEAAQIGNTREAVELTAGLLGRFNIENLLCALTILRATGCTDFSNIGKAVAGLTPVLGRMQIVHRQPTVVVDFAHTADGLKALLSAVKEHLPQSGSLWVLFGCGGDRDQAKRPQMAQVAESFADQIVITSDNPRTEPAEKIAQQIIAGLTSDAYALQLDRKQAIDYALYHANVNDVVVIAGKGHENSQEIQGVKRPFSDQAVVAAFYRPTA